MSPQNFRPSADAELVTQEQTLADESNHRIANNLAVIAGLLRQQARGIVAEKRSYSAHEVSNMLNEVGHRIDVVGRFHRLLSDPTPGEAVDLGDYLHEVAESAISAMSPTGHITLEPLPQGACGVHTSQALLIGLIVGELVTNAVKYAHPARVKGRLRLTCGKESGATVITVEDDGVGFPEGFDPALSRGFGLRTARLLADQLKATLSFDSGPLGLTARVVVPYAAPCP